MAIKYVHTNIVSRDWRRLAEFYIQVFDCEPVPPERDLSGEWLAKGSGVKQATISGVHLRLPGYGSEGPTLEIYQYAEPEERPTPAANRLGIGHMAFLVEDVQEKLTQVLEAGGEALGEVSSHEISGVGHLTFVYATYPEGNILELQKWD